jgi:hypothetical protein
MEPLLKVCLIGCSMGDFCKCHYIFLPTNIVVGDSETPTPQLAVIDWEWVRRGNDIFEVGFFTGEVLPTEFFHSWRDFADYCSRSYLKERNLTVGYMIKVARRFAMHVVYWATQER